MRNMLALFGAALLAFVGVGWYLGWYKVRSQAASVPGQHSLNIDINTNKITKDLQQSEQRLQQILEKKGGEEIKNAAGGLTLPSPEVPSDAKVKSGRQLAVSVPQRQEVIFPPPV